MQRITRHTAACRGMPGVAAHSLRMTCCGWPLSFWRSSVVTTCIGRLTVSRYARRAGFPGVQFCRTLLYPARFPRTRLQSRGPVCVRMRKDHIRALRIPAAHCQSLLDDGNTQTPSRHRRLGSATLSLLAFPGESDPNSSWEKSQWDNTVVYKKKKKITPPMSRRREEEKITQRSTIYRERTR